MDYPGDKLPPYYNDRGPYTEEDLQRAVAKAVEEERSLCADLLCPSRWEGHPASRDEALRIIQDAIRARKVNHV